MARKYRVLVVDDSKSILDALAKAFAGSPYEVVVCDDPVGAYERIEDENFDIVISDIMIPRLDGLSLLRKIKNFNGSKLPVRVTINGIASHDFNDKEIRVREIPAEVAIDY